MIKNGKCSALVKASVLWFLLIILPNLNTYSLKLLVVDLAVLLFTYLVFLWASYEN